MELAAAKGLVGLWRGLVDPWGTAWFGGGSWSWRVKVAWPGSAGIKIVQG